MGIRILSWGILFCFISGGYLSASESYYDLEPCRRYKIQDFPVAVAPWQETSSSVFSENCDWSISKSYDFFKLSEDLQVKTLEEKVLKTLNDYFQYQQGIATTLECCLDDEYAVATKTNHPKCIADKSVEQFCRGDSKEASFKGYVDDINHRLTALRIAAFRMNEHKNGYENATKFPIKTNKMIIQKVMGSLGVDSFSVNNMPSYLEPLSKEEIALAQQLLAATPQENDFPYKRFVTKRDPENDYYTILTATPFLAETTKRQISHEDLKNSLIKFREKNFKNEFSEFKTNYYRDFMGLVADAINKYDDTKAQRKLCQRAEYQSNLAKLGVVVLKEIPLVVATVAGVARGKAAIRPGESIKEIVSKLGTSMGVSATAGLTLSGVVDLARSKNFDEYCSKKFSDSNVEAIAPLCNQLAIIKNLESTQENLFYAAGFSGITGGFALFRAKKAKDILINNQKASSQTKGTELKGVEESTP